MENPKKLFHFYTYIVQKQWHKLCEITFFYSHLLISVSMIFALYKLLCGNATPLTVYTPAYIWVKSTFRACMQVPDIMTFANFYCLITKCIIFHFMKAVSQSHLNLDQLYLWDTLHHSHTQNCDRHFFRETGIINFHGDFMLSNKIQVQP